jgi:hypothetical protein
MLSLYRSGRQADALAAYQRARTLLADELGLEPGPELRRMEGDVLAQSPSLDHLSVPPLSPMSTGPAGPRITVEPHATIRRVREGSVPPARLLLPDGGSIPLPAGKLSLGRHDGADVVLRDSLASRRHAVIVGSADGYRFVDLNSTNGSEVNGAVVTEHRLVDGDEILIGTTRLQFVLGEP